ncbi:MAG: hypothetical protein GWN33_03925, partial [Gammaproteobacteria bacterium]|nr:hypothetical protein [Gammaproteobacteria bacterium]
LVSGDNQTAIVNTSLSSPFVVRVNDAFGNPVSGITITWAVGSGAGAINPTSSVTGVNGQTSAI